jgi:UDP-N-acetylmuramate dehydrogenase
MNYKFLENVINSTNCNALKNEPMSKHTSFKIGGNADFFVSIEDKAALRNLMRVILSEKIPYYVIGNGCNTLVSDKGFKGVVIKLCENFSKLKLIDNSIISCGAAVKLSTLCCFALKNSLEGLEFAWGIPATIGGAVYMNAGAYTGEIKDILLTTEHLDENLNFKTLKKENLVGFGYRESVYTNTKKIITHASFVLKKGNKLEIKSKMDNFAEKRRQKQPLELPNAGSIFKRPEHHFVGALIDECHLRGTSIGGAQVSEKHAGFIVNKKNATCKDILDLICLIKEKVYKKSGVTLIPEIKILKD